MVTTMGHGGDGDHGGDNKNSGDNGHDDDGDGSSDTCFLKSSSNKSRMDIILSKNSRQAAQNDWRWT